MRLAGISLLALACLSACDEVRPGVVWQSEFAGDQEAIVECLKSSSAFERAKKIGPGNRSYFEEIDPEAYVVDGRMTLHFLKGDGQTQRIEIRSDTDLSWAESSALNRCLESQG